MIQHPNSDSSEPLSDGRFEVKNNRLELVSRDSIPVAFQTKEEKGSEAPKPIENSGSYREAPGRAGGTNTQCSPRRPSVLGLAAVRPQEPSRKASKSDLRAQVRQQIAGIMFWRKALEDLPIGTIVTEDDGTALIVNKVARMLFGLEEEFGKVNLATLFMEHFVHYEELITPLMRGDQEVPQRGANICIWGDDRKTPLKQTPVLVRVRKITVDHGVSGYMVEIIDQTEAATDPLTGLFNRGTYNQKIVDEVKRVSRGNGCLSLLVFDLDHFKSINDTKGHAIGDGVLRIVGEILRLTCRATDIPARYGGEEFVLVLPGTSTPGAQGIAERIRALIERQTIDLSGEKFRVTVSVGVSTMVTKEAFPLQSTTVEDRAKELNAAIETMVTNLFERADKALYTAKKAGRNRVVVSAG